MDETPPPKRGSHQRLRALRQNRGMARSYHGASMRDRVPSLTPGRAAAVCLLVAGVLALSLPSASHAFASQSLSGTAFGGQVVSASAQTWNNGRIALTFAGPYPSFSVVSMTDSSVSVNQSLTGLAELNATDAIRSFASFGAPGVTWSLSSSSTPQRTAVVLMAAVPVKSSGGEWESGDDSGGGNGTIGTANVSITFGLNASSTSNPWSVSYSLNVSGWPWLHPADAVGVEVRSNATSPSAYWASGGANQLTELSRAHQQPLASFVWGATAKAQYSGGSIQDSYIGSYRNLSAGGSGFLVRLEFGSVTGGYTHLSYDPWLAIVPSGASLGKLAAWVLSPTSLAVIVGGGAASVILAGLARSRRSPPESGL